MIYACCQVILEIVCLIDIKKWHHHASSIVDRRSQYDEHGSWHGTNRTKTSGVHNHTLYNHTMPGTNQNRSCLPRCSRDHCRNRIGVIIRRIRSNASLTGRHINPKEYTSTYKSVHQLTQMSWKPAKRCSLRQNQHIRIGKKENQIYSMKGMILESRKQNFIREGRKPNPMHWTYYHRSDKSCRQTSRVEHIPWHRNNGIGKAN